MVLPSVRLTPARAGNTTTQQKQLITQAAHPRSRGEHHAVVHGGGDRFGSPPLARGTPAGSYKVSYPFRLTPARAGNTRPKTVGAGANPAHPRSRGEHEPSFTCHNSPSGSPPLARGTPPPGFVLLQVLRLTPARAGNTNQAQMSLYSSPAHPRSRGEHWHPFHQIMQALGSPPLARGTLMNPVEAKRAGRLTPARAGNTHMM